MDKKVIESYLNKAKSQPNHEVRFIEEGFCFLLYWVPQRSWFECTMLFNPKWPHSHHLYGKTNEDFIESLEEKIADAKQIFKNGGKYSAE